jgi:hypothetical protein
MWGEIDTGVGRTGWQERSVRRVETRRGIVTVPLLNQSLTGMDVSFPTDDMSLLSPGEDVLIDIDDKEPLIPIQVRWVLGPLGEMLASQELVLISSSLSTPHCILLFPHPHYHTAISGWVLHDGWTQIRTVSLVEGQSVCSSGQGQSFFLGACEKNGPSTLGLC